MSVRIIVDSSADLIPEVKDRVSVVPMTVHFGDKEYIDGVTITNKEFYERLVESSELPRTSQANPTAYTTFFEEVKNSGDSAVVISLSSTFSGTYQSAVIAASEYENIYVVDSKTLAIGAGILIEYAIQLVDKGLEAKEIAEILDKEKENVRIIAMVDTLEYLHRGGRVSKTVAIAGGLMNIKPVISVNNGEFIMLGKARGSKQGNNLLVTEIEKAGGVDFSRPVLLGYTGLSDALLQKYIEDSKDLWSNSKTELNVALIGSIIGTHAGPGAVAAAFFKN